MEISKKHILLIWLNFCRLLGFSPYPLTTICFYSSCVRAPCLSQSCFSKLNLWTGKPQDAWLPLLYDNFNSILIQAAVLFCAFLCVLCFAQCPKFSITTRKTILAVNIPSDIVRHIVWPSSDWFGVCFDCFTLHSFFFQCDWEILRIRRRLSSTLPRHGPFGGCEICWYYNDLGSWLSSTDCKLCLFSWFSQWEKR